MSRSLPHQPASLFQLKAERERLEAEASDLSQQLSDVRTSLNQINAKIARITNSTAPLYTLPDEIITAIIHAGLCTSRTFAICVSHVTHHLREVAIGSPSLWTRIRITSGGSLDEVDTYLQRSERCLLDIRVVVRRAIGVLALYPLGSCWPAILSQISRWRSLSISSDHTFNSDINNTALSDVFKHLRSICAPRLDRLHIFVPGYILPPHLFIDGATMASEVSMDYDDIFLNPPLHSSTSITSLNIQEEAFSSYDHLCHFLLTFPRLTNLTLRGKASLSSRNDHMTASLPCLSTFEIIGDPDYICNIFSRLVIPGLRCLKISATLSVFTGFLNWLSEAARAGSPYPALQSLSFGLASLRSESLKTLVYSLPNITNITVSVLKYYELYRYEEEENTGTIALKLLYDITAWPHLDALTFEGFDETDEQFMRILCSIITFRPSIRSVRLVHLDFGDSPFPEGSPEITVEDTPKSSPEITAGDAQYSIAWLQRNVYLEYFTVCKCCGGMWDHENRTWEHHCILP